VGGEPVAHGNRCQCECEAVGGARARPGDFWCHESLGTTVEASPPCDELDPTLFTIACNDRGSMIQGSTIFDANAVLGLEIEAGYTGQPANCHQLAQDNVGTVRTASNTVTLDGGLGDQSSPGIISCRGPNYNLGP
jgi:hypothetical protein